MPSKSTLISANAIIQSSSKITKDLNAILITDDIITDIGNKTDLLKEYSPDLIVEHDQAIILPGFVNTHTHSVQTFFRGAADDFQLMDWLSTVILPGEATFTAEEVYASSLLGFMDMIRNGTTFANDMLTVNHVEKGIQAAIDSGIRVKIGKMLMDYGANLPQKMIEDTNQSLEHSRKLIESYHNKNPVLEYSLNPRFLVTCSEKLLRGVSDLLQEYPTVCMHTHANENKKELEIIKEIHNEDNIKALHNYGNLGNRSILAHGVWMDNSDLKLVSHSNTAIAHCPSSNAKLASGIADWPKYQSENILVGLGTDGAPCNNTMDMIREMRMASFLQRVSKLDETIAPAKQVFDLATINGARALRKTNIGTLEIGKKADLVVLDISDPTHSPIHDYLSHVVYKANGTDIIQSFVDGKIIYDADTENFVERFKTIPKANITKAFSILENYIYSKPWLERDPN